MKLVKLNILLCRLFPAFDLYAIMKMKQESDEN